MTVSEAAVQEACPSQRKPRLQILSLSSVFPNRWEPLHGVFVRARLAALAEEADINVIAPVPAIDYSGSPLRREAPPQERQDGLLRVRHPRWLFPPGGTALNVVPLFMRLAWPVRRIVQESHVQLIDAHFGYPEGIVAGMLARVYGLPFVVTLRGNEPLHAESRAKRELLSWSLRRAARVITVSRRLRDFAIGLGVAAERVVTIPNGVDSSVFYARDRAAARRHFGLAENERVVLSAGSLIRRKGHHHVMEALASLRRRGLTTTLLIAGGPGREGRFEVELRRFAQQDGCGENVRFLGTLRPDDLATAMSAADLFCLASSREGWPNVLHEALACGTPTIATDVGAVHDMIPHAGLGSVVPSPDPRHLEPALEAALVKHWDRDAISRFGQSRSWKAVASEVLHCFQEIIHLTENNE